MDDALDIQDRARIVNRIQVRRAELRGDLSEDENRGLIYLSEMVSSNQPRVTIRDNVDHWKTMGGVNGRVAAIFDQILMELGIHL